VAHDSSTALQTTARYKECNFSDESIKLGIKGLDIEIVRSFDTSQSSEVPLQSNGNRLDEVYISHIDNESNTTSPDQTQTSRHLS
jgi:hypothetical protein